MKQFCYKDPNFRAVIPTKLSDLGNFDISLTNRSGYIWSIEDDDGKRFWEIDLSFIVVGLGISFNHIYGKEEA